MINMISTTIDRINRILLIVSLVLVGVIAVVYVIKLAPQWVATISQQAEKTSKKTSSGSICPSKSGYITCGYCSEDRFFSDNPNAGQCIYCPTGTKCQGDVCEGITCSGGSGTTGGGSSSPSINYYVLCWDCQAVKNVSYNGRDATICGYYWNLCDIYQCRNMRRKCW